MLRRDTFSCGKVCAVDENVQIFVERVDIEEKRAVDVGGCARGSPDNPAEGWISQCVLIHFFIGKSTSYIGMVPNKPTLKDFGSWPTFVVRFP